MVVPIPIRTLSGRQERESEVIHTPLIGCTFKSARARAKGWGRITQTLVRKRESIDIISEMLNNVVDGVHAKTHLQQRSNLDSREMKHYMVIITERGLLSSVKDGRGHESYRLTERGRDFLLAYNNLEGFL